MTILPKFLEPILPSYDISKMDLNHPNDKKLIIEAVLNHGTTKEIKWLFKTYNSKEIKNVIKNPSRGCWDIRVLNFWTKIFKVEMHPTTYEMAILDLSPSKEKRAKWFNFIKKKADKKTLKIWKELGLLKMTK